MASVQPNVREDDYKQCIEDLEKVIEEKKQENSQLRQRIQELESELDSTRNELDRKSQEIEELSGKLDVMQSEQRRHNDEKQIMALEMQHLKDMNSQLTTDVSEKIVDFCMKKMNSMMLLMTGDITETEWQRKTAEMDVESDAIKKAVVKIETNRGTVAGSGEGGDRLPSALCVQTPESENAVGKLSDNNSTPAEDVSGQQDHSEKFVGMTSKIEELMMKISSLQRELVISKQRRNTRKIQELEQLKKLEQLNNRPIPTEVQDVMNKMKQETAGLKLETSNIAELSVDRGAVQLATASRKRQLPGEMNLLFTFYLQLSFKHRCSA